MERELGASEAAPAAAALFAWGANSYGQLGLGHKQDVLLPQQLTDFCKPECVRKITGGGGHSTIVIDGGGLFVCGLNKDGQLGLGHTEDVLCFTFCKSLGGCPIQQVACGWDFTIMLTESGQVLSCGSNAFGQLGVPPGPRRCLVPQAIELLREKVVCVAAGLRHALAATVSGTVFQWGTGLASSGRQLCPGHTLPLFLTAEEPSRVTGLENSKAICVLAGSAHSAALTETGKVFTWGRADYGQLGRNLDTQEDWKLEKQDSFCPCSGPENCTPSSLPCLMGAAEISCGSEHNLAVIGGTCYSWGWNEHGMCGDGTEANVWAPKPVQDLLLVPGLLVGCGAGHSLALCQLPGQPAPDKDLNVTYHPSNAIGDTESQEALDKEKLEGEIAISTQSQTDKSRNEKL
ncbi:secretion-regulating guanine nucleotide exchange factor [Octodon degus]|uniref:Secretion-regulating guanine nucleotide exchange factor n=1 Tax=Octodon degus TaxID=10160 RepID=A0A6P3F9K6_OCTDE|nr:secretion-regulating guanine nucleotide exchange factor [Octodon degus]